MKLLALRLCEHDSNFSYFDGEKLHYFKSERSTQIKHHSFNNLWQWKDVIKEIWNVDYREIDEIAIVIDPWHHNLPCDKEDFFPVREYEYLHANCKVWRINHHYAHALSSWPIETQEATIRIVLDGFGDQDVSWSVFKNGNLLEKGSLEKNGSMGTEMCEAGRYLGVRSEHGQDISGKVMGLQAYGTLDTKFLEILRSFDIYTVRELFSIKHWFEYKNDILLGNLTPLDWIKTVHHRCSEILLDFFAKYATKEDIISYTGGVAQNVIWNTEIRKQFPNLIIPPHCADEGLSLGAIEYLRIKNNLPRFQLEGFPYCQMDQNAEEPSDETIYKTAKLLAEGNTVGWYQDHGEIGPRALGNRSILLNPLLDNGKFIANTVKNREEYRPFGASVLKEYALEYFDLDYDNPYMLYVAKVKSEKLSSITHIDGTCRVQTVDEQNLVFQKLLRAFYEITGCPVLLNTSLNLAGKPLAGYHNDALQLYNDRPLNCLVIGNQIYQKR